MKKTDFLASGWAVIIPLASAVGVYVFAVFLPTMREIHTLQTETGAQESMAVEVARQSAELPRIEADIRATRDYLRRWRGIGPKPAELAGVFAKLAELVTRSGATTTIFKPEAKHSLGAVDRTQLTLGCRGTFPQIQALLAAIEGLRQPTWLEDTVLSRAEDGESVDCEIKLAIFADKFEISD